MTKQIKIVALSLLGIALCGCSQVKETYPAGKYESAIFENNYYTGRHDFKDKTGASLQAIEIDSSKYFNGDSAEDFGAYDQLTLNGTVPSRKGLRSMYPEVLQYEKKAADGTSSTVTLAADSLNDWRYVDTGKDSEFIGKSFGRTKCLAITDSSFKEGFLSKLYNGQLFCDGDHMRALVQFDQVGYDAAFPKTLASGDYFLISLRGGSTYLYDNPKHATNSAEPEKSALPRLTELDLNLKFYKANGSAFDYYSITAKNVLVRTDDGGEGVSFFGFKFSDIGIKDTAGIAGMSFSYSNFQDPGIGTAQETIDAATPKDFYWGALVYEVMFPDSSWH
jgi:hypothetical protein